MGKNAIILCSGGADSVTAAYFVNKKWSYDKLVFLFFDYGQRTLKQEEKCVKYISTVFKADFVKIKLKWLGKLSTSFINKTGADFPVTQKEDLKNSEIEKKSVINWWVPCRNTVFLSSALAYAESYDLSGKGKYDLVVGFGGGSIPFNDTSTKYVGIMNNFISECTYHGGYKIMTPVIDKDKDQIIKIGCELGVDFSKTYSCYIGGEKKLNHCGKCAQCVHRKQAFYWAGLNDPTVYDA